MDEPIPAPETVGPEAPAATPTVHAAAQVPPTADPSQAPLSSSTASSTKPGGIEHPEAATALTAASVDGGETGGGGGDKRGGGPNRLKRYRVPGLIGLVLIVAGIVVAVVLATGGSSTPPGQPFSALGRPVPTNHVTGGGTATLLLNGDVLTATVRTHGLINQPHFIHIHAGGLGVCPPASAARLHNGHLSISTGNGIKFYGPPQVALTTSGDTSVKSIVASQRYPSVGNINYHRTFTIPPGVAASIRAGNAVFIVHGIDYDNAGFYDSFLGPSDLDSKLPGEATAPALCGTIFPVQTTASVGRPGTTVYAVVLHRPVAASSAEAIRFALLCHLAALDSSPATDPRANRVTAT
jgi:hypothetical protein